MMKRLFLFFALLLLPVAAWAQCPGGLITNCLSAVDPQPTDWLLLWQNSQNPHSRKLPLGGASGTGTFIFAIDYGVSATNSSNDVQLAAAYAACAAVGGKLVLPPGILNMTGAGNTPIQLGNCAMVGAGGFAANFGGAAGWGTTLSFTSTTVAPFYTGNNFGIADVNFWWPNQTGATIYPALFLDNGAGMTEAWFDRIGIVNAYIGWQEGTGPWGGISVTNSEIYAVKDVFRIHDTGNYIDLVNDHFEPAQWLEICNFSAVCESHIDTASANNAILHATAASGPGWGPKFLGGLGFDWRYGILVDSGGVFTPNIVGTTFDGMQTLIDSSSGGGLTGNAQLSSMFILACVRFNYQGAAQKTSSPCFNLGANGALVVIDMRTFGDSGGDTFKSAGTTITVLNSQLPIPGQVADGGNYYCVHFTGVNATTLRMQNSFCQGRGTNKIHGIYDGGNLLNSAIVKGNSFLALNDIIDINANTPPFIFAENQSGGTIASPSVVFTGSSPTAGVIYANNGLDKGPAFSVSACGTGCALATDSGFAGTINVGSTNPTTTGQLTLPFSLPAMACQFTVQQGSGQTVNAVNSFGGTWTWTASADVHSGKVDYNCYGSNN